MPFCLRRLLRASAVAGRAFMLVAALTAVVAVAEPLSTMPPAAGAAEQYITPPSGSWPIAGAGFGHGIGLSQWGAQGAAYQGLQPDQILSFYYPGTTLGYVGDPTIRVQLTAYSGTAIVFGAYGNEQLGARDLTTGEQVALPPASRYLLTLDGSNYYISLLTGSGWALWRAFVGPLDVAGPSGTWVYSTDLSGAGRQYWGTLRLLRTSPSTAQAVNVLDMDSYLKFVVPREMPSSFLQSALQAQAVAARSYALSVSQPAQPWDICDTTACQVYGGRAVAAPGGSVTWLEAGSTSTAVQATSGIVVADSASRPAFTQFSASNGGYSVAGSKPYLVAQPDPYSGAAPGDPVSRWSATLSKSTLQSRCPSGGTLNGFQITGRDGRGPFGGRITSLVVQCSNGNVTVTGTSSLAFGMLSNMWQPVNLPFGNAEVIEAANGGVHVSGWAISPDGNPASITVSTGSTAVTLDATLPRPDVASVYPAFGPNHGFDAVVQAIGGTNTVCVTASSSSAATVLRCQTVNVPGGGPIGAFDNARGVPGSGGGGPGIATVGWAIDPDTNAPIAVHLYPSSGPAIAVTASAPRPDVGNAFPLYGPNHGFNAFVPAASGSNGIVCAYAINVPGPAANPIVGCRHYVVPGGSPIGNLEQLAATSGGTQLSVWTIDPYTADPIRLSVTVDGSATYSLAAAQSRPDVGNVFPDYGAAHGFSVLLPTGPGSHNVCVRAVNVGVGSDTTLGCGTVVVPSGAPMGNLDSVTGLGGASPAVHVVGWAIDPDLGTGPDSVLVVVDNTSATLLANKPRSDVGNVFPAYGPNHGFDAFIGANHGAHSVCAYAFNQPGGALGPWLGCATVVVP